MTDSSLALSQELPDDKDGQASSATANEPDIGAIEQYLLEHPDLLEKHPELVAHLHLPEPPEGIASLPHFQLRLWRRAVADLHGQIDALHEAAHANAQLDQLMHHFAAALLGKTERTAAALNECLHAHFAIDHIALVDWASLDAKGREPLMGWADNGYPLCGRLTESQRQVVFGDSLPETGSAALIGLRDDKGNLTHILGLGRDTPDGFNPAQGTLFLSQIGELAAAFLNAPAN